MPGSPLQSAIVFALSNFSLTFLVVGWLFAAVAIARASTVTSALVVEKLLAWHVFWVTGVCNLYNFVMHVFFGEVAARFIGWADSPFQTEVGFASLGFAAVGFLAFRGDRGLRIAAVVGPSLFLLGAAGGHIYQMITAHNFAAGNAGIIFWTDILVPAIGFGLLYLQSRHATARSQPLD